MAAGLVLVAVLLLVAWRFASALGLLGTSSTEPDQVEEAILRQDFTPRTLAKYNGIQDKHVLLAVRGRVYDVTSGKAHYGPGGPYENFAGRDASRGLATHSFDASVLTPLDEPIDTLQDLSAEEIQALDQWAEFFAGKYHFVGELKNN